TKFTHQVFKGSTPDEIFGPISIKKLKENDQYKRITDRYLPSANIIFLDEIWKAGPAIQNALLTILNEKIYRNGDEDMFVNINGIITASNELPPANKNLAPIWDRFLLRLEVGGIRKFDNFLQMIVNTDDPYRDDIPKSLKIAQAELDGWDEAINRVEVPAEVLNTIQLVKVKVEEHNSKPNHLDNQIPVFDRRWKKIIRLLRTSAFLSGRAQVDLIDCFLMVHCLWAKPTQLELIQEIVSEAIRKHGYSMAVNLSMLKKEVQEFEQEVDQETKVKYTKVEERLLPIEEEYFELVKSDEKFEGSRITIKQFKNLSLSEHSVTNFYDGNGSLVNRLKTKKGTQEYTIAVDYNSITYTYRLKTQKVEKSEIIYRKAHHLLLEHWEERTAKVKKYIEVQLDKLQTQRTAHHDVSSLFVEKTLEEIVLSNLNDTEEVLKKLQIRLEKLAYAYQKD
ncbi:MAG: AAA family ATPase, partial [Bacteroidota bacterium]